MKRIGTYDWHQAHGAVFETFFDCEIPSHYGDFQKEYQPIRKSAAVRDVSHFGKIRVTGKDRQRFLNGMLTGDIKKLEPGKGVWALSLDVKGHIQADMKVYGHADHLLIVCQHYAVERLMKGLDRYIISEDVQMKEVTDEYGMVQILGPESEAWLRSKITGDLPADTLSFQAGAIGGKDAQIIRLPAGFAVLCAMPDAVAILNVLDGPLAGWKAFDTYRIESGLALLGRDVTEANFAQECRWIGALDFHKGCYLGQETMARIDAQGHVNRVLMGFSAGTALKEGDKIMRADKEFGKITSATHSLLLGQPFAIGYLRREAAKEGESVEIGDDRTTAIVKELPLQG